MWHTSITLIAAVFVVNITIVTCLPRDLQSREGIGTEPTFSPDIGPKDQNKLKPASQLLPFKINNKSKVSFDVTTPLAGSGKTNKEKNLATLFLINLSAVKNKTADNLNDVLHNDVFMEVPNETAVPLSLFLLIIKDEDEKIPVNLDEVAKDAENEGLVVEKVIKDGKTRLVKVNLDSISILEDTPYKNSNSKNISEQKTKIQKFGPLASIRRKRNTCLCCTVIVIKKTNHRPRHRGGYHGGYHGYKKGCGGGYGCWTYG